VALPRVLVCAECWVKGERSRVTCVGVSKTLIDWTPFWDEEGNQHAHDPNVTTHAFACTRGHQFCRKETARCPNHGCDWEPPVKPA